MINLIPNQEKKIMIKDFYYRLATVFFITLGLVMLIASVALLPSYFISSAKKNSVIKKLNAVPAESVGYTFQETLSFSAALDKKLSLLERAQKDKFLISKRVVGEIIFKKMPDVKITEISFEQTEAEGKKINIRGTAPSRERLLLFRQALEDDPLFKKVDLPISNFIKGSNIQFYLSLIPA